MAVAYKAGEHGLSRPAAPVEAVKAPVSAPAEDKAPAPAQEKKTRTRKKSAE
jgi:hypothetical protein